MSKSHFQAPLLLALVAYLAACQLIPSSWAAFDTGEFEEDPAKPQEDDLDWPEVTFPSLEARGKGFSSGERLEYRAQWGIFRKAGKMVITTEKENTEEGNKLIISTETSSYGLIRSLYPLDHVARTIVDPEHWRMERNEVDAKVRSEKSKTLTLIDYEHALMSYEDSEEPEHNKVRNLPYTCLLDYSGTFLQVRGYDLAVGAIYPIFVCSKSKFYLVELKVVDIDRIDTPMGKKQCFRLEPISAFPESRLFREGGKFSVWITTDSDRIPVRFDVKTSVGTASMRLENYEAPSAKFASR